MPASPVYADRARSGFGAYREVEAEPRRSAERLTPLAEAQGLTARSAERTSSGPLATDRLVPLSGAAPLNGGTMSSMSSGCTGPTDETIYNVYNAAGQLVLVDKAHLCQMTLYIQGAGTTVTRIEVDTAASTLTRTYLHPDHLGSAAAGTSQSGTVLWREQYTPYGEKLTAPTANDNQGSFTGHIDDADTGLTYMQARYYDPSMARFLSVDPVGFVDTGHPGMFNRYAYVGNDPINFNDPTGMLRCEKDDRCDSVHDAGDKARDKLSDAQSGIDSLRGAIKSGADLTSDQQATKTSFETYFGEGSATSVNLKKVSKVLGKTFDKIGARGEGAKINFVAGKHGNAQMTAPLNGNTINVYSGYKPNSSTNSYLISHEAGHLAGVTDQMMPAGTPSIYGRNSTVPGFVGLIAQGNNAAWYLGKNNSSLVGKNNDNYQYFTFRSACY